MVFWVCSFFFLFPFVLLGCGLWGFFGFGFLGKRVIGFDEGFQEETNGRRD